MTPCAHVVKLLEALEDAKDGLANAYDDLANCLEHRCVPTKGEVFSCGFYLKEATEALAAARAHQCGEECGK